jgi:hypothetical protein
MLVAIAALWFGRSPLGVLNFLLVQWFGVRIARSMEWTEDDGTQVTVLGQHEQSLGRVVDIVAKRGGRTRWFLVRWVWPLTGWWSEYRWIVRRGGVR